MAKYLIKASYSADGLKGVMKAGGKGTGLHGGIITRTLPPPRWTTSPPLRSRTSMPQNGAPLTPVCRRGSRSFA